RRRHTRFSRDWSSDVCSSDLRSTRQAAPARSEFRKMNRSAGAGIAVGVAIGVAMDNLAMGIGIGIAIPIAMGLVFRKSEDGDQRSEERRGGKGWRRRWAECA